MSVTAAGCETGRLTPHYFRPAAASREEMAGRCAGTLGVAPYHRAAVPLESCPDPALCTPGITDDSADHGIPARLLFISNDWALTPERLRGAFPAPAHPVQVVGTADAGLEHISTDLPDVIVLDLGLHDQSGLEVYQQIRRVNAHVPVVVVAGARRADAAIEPIKQGAYDCLFKPLGPALFRRSGRRGRAIIPPPRPPPLTT